MKSNRDSTHGALAASSVAQALPKAQMQHRILMVAAELFRTKGYSGATTRELADLLDLKKASLYHYVSSKAQLLFDICEMAIQTISDEVTAAMASDPEEERLASAIRAHIRASVQDRDLHSVMWTEFRYLDASRRYEILLRRAEYEAQLGRLVRYEQKKNRLRNDVDYKDLTRLLLNLLNWTIFWFDPQGPLDSHQLGDLLAEQFFQGAREISTDRPVDRRRVARYHAASRITSGEDGDQTPSERGLAVDL